MKNIKNMMWRWSRIALLISGVLSCSLMAQQDPVALKKKNNKKNSKTATQRSYATQDQAFKDLVFYLNRLKANPAGFSKTNLRTVKSSIDAIKSTSVEEKNMVALLLVDIFNQHIQGRKLNNEGKNVFKYIVAQNKVLDDKQITHVSTYYIPALFPQGIASKRTEVKASVKETSLPASKPVVVKAEPVKPAPSLQQQKIVEPAKDLDVVQVIRSIVEQNNQVAVIIPKLSEFIDQHADKKIDGRSAGTLMLVLKSIHAQRGAMDDTLKQAFTNLLNKTQVSPLISQGQKVDVMGMLQQVQAAK